MTETPHPDWLALHIFYHHFEKQDALLIEGLLPAVRRMQEMEKVTKWFFLRYWEGGPHLRIRFYKPDRHVEEVIREAAEVFIKTHPPTQVLTREQYYQNHRFDGEEVQVERLPWYEHGSVVRLPYFPEYERYGGMDAMPISEDLFYGSSELVVKLIQTVPHYQERISRAMDLMIITALILCVEPRELAPFFKRYAYFWRRYVDQSESVEEKIRESFIKQKEILIKRLQLLIKLSRAEATFTMYDPWIRQLHQAREAYWNIDQQGKLLSPMQPSADQFDRYRFAVSSIAFSQIHMTNNRLGVPPAYEHYLGTMIYLTAEAYDQVLA